MFVKPSLQSAGVVRHVCTLRRTGKFQHANRQSSAKLFYEGIARNASFAPKYRKIASESLIKQFDSTVRKRDERLQREVSCERRAT